MDTRSTEDGDGFVLASTTEEETTVDYRAPTPAPHPFVGKWWSDPFEVWLERWLLQFESTSHEPTTLEEWAERERAEERFKDWLSSLTEEERYLLRLMSSEENLPVIHLGDELPVDDQQPSSDGGDGWGGQDGGDGWGGLDGPGPDDGWGGLDGPGVDPRPFLPGFDDGGGGGGHGKFWV